MISSIFESRYLRIRRRYQYHSILYHSNHRAELRRDWVARKGIWRGSEGLNFLLAKQNAFTAEGLVMICYSNDESAFWRSLRRELVKDGCPGSVIQGHKELIQAYVKDLGSREVLDDMGISRISPSNLTYFLVSRSMYICLCEYMCVCVCVRKTLITEEIKKGKSNISIKGKRLKYHFNPVSKLRHRGVISTSPSPFQISLSYSGELTAATICKAPLRI